MGLLEQNSIRISSKADKKSARQSNQIREDFANNGWLGSTLEDSLDIWAWLPGRCFLKVRKGVKNKFLKTGSNCLEEKVSKQKFVSRNLDAQRKRLAKEIQLVMWNGWQDKAETNISSKVQTAEYMQGLHNAQDLHRSPATCNGSTMKANRNPCLPLDLFW